LQNTSDISSNADLLLQNSAIELALDIINKYPKSEQILLHLFKFLQNIAETNEDFRKICLSKPCVSSISEIIGLETTKEHIRIAGILAKDSIEIENDEILPEANEILGMVFKFKLGQSKSMISKEKKNFLLAGRICKL